MNNGNERLEKLIGFLIYKGYISIKSTQRDLASKIDMDYTNISKAFKFQGNHIKTLIKKINSAFGDLFSEDWLLNGEGEMLKTGDNVILGNNNSHNQQHSGIGSIVNIPDTAKKIINDDGIEINLDQSTKIASLEQTIEHLSTRVADLEETIKAKDKAIDAMQMLISKLSES